MILLTVWASVGVALAAVGLYLTGRDAADPTKPDDDTDISITASLAVGLFWPLLIALAALALIGWAPYGYGRHRGNRRIRQQREADTP